MTEHVALEMERRRDPQSPPPDAPSQGPDHERTVASIMTMVANARPESSDEPDEAPTLSAGELREAQDVEARLMLALGILDHRLALRDRYPRGSVERAAFIRLTEHDVRMALAGATIEQIAETRAA